MTEIIQYNLEALTGQDLDSLHYISHAVKKLGNSLYILHIIY